MGLTGNGIEAATAIAALPNTDVGVLGALIDALPMPVAARDAKGTTLVANRAAEERGWGRPDQQTLDQDRLALELGSPITSARTQVPNGEGQARWVVVQRIPFAISRGRTAVLAVETDVSDQVRAEQAEHDSEARDGFVASMSHEMRTPLNSLMGFSQLLLERGSGSLDERQRRYLENVSSSSRQLLALVNDALDISKIDAGRFELCVEKVPVMALLEEAATMMGPMASAKAIRLTVKAPERLFARADRRRLHQALLNLLSNAIKFTPPGGQVEVRAGRVDDHVEIEVADTGPGIPPPEQGKIFDEFVQLDRDRQRHEGTGLGLALARRLVELMGGRLELKRSDAQSGSTFAITVPGEPSSRSKTLI